MPKRSESTEPAQSIKSTGPSRTQRFQPLKPDNASLHEHNISPQVPATKTNSTNQYRGHGRGQ